MNSVELAARVEAKRVGREFLVLCSAHPDHDPSLSFTDGAKGVVFTCRSRACKCEDILQAWGLTVADVMYTPRASAPAVVRHFVYTDEHGAPLTRAVRREPGFNGKRKSIWQEHLTPAGKWVKGTDGVRRVPYRLRELQGQPAVCIPEGEPHCDRLAASCHAAGLSVRIVALLGLREKSDVLNYLDAGHTRDELLAQITAAPLYTPAPTVPAHVRPLNAILDDVCAYLKTYVVLSDHQADILRAWTAHTHALEAADATPYIHVGSPEPECGKTRLLETEAALVARPWLTAYTTKATLVRKVDRQQPTLLLDELDAALKTDVEYVEALRGVLNSGYLRSGTYSMCIGQGSTLTDKDYRTFSAKMLAGIGQLPRTIASRSIPITLKRARRMNRSRSGANGTVERWRRRCATT